MRPQRIFNLHHNPPGCPLCDTVGLGRRENSFDLPSGELLSRSGYTHAGWGCLKAPEALDPNLRNIKFIHSLDEIGSETNDHCLLVSSLKDPCFRKSAPESINSLLLIPRKTEDLRHDLHLLHPSWWNHLRFYWPHHSLVQNFGWKWTELLDFIRYANHAFPQFKLQALEGLDLFNPEIEPDLETELTVSSKLDDRKNNFSPRVSVVIPTYNNKDHVGRTVKNLLSLGRDDMEIIVVDDGSTDGTFASLSDLHYFSGSRENFVVLNTSRPRPRRMGLGAYRAGVSRNCGARESRGDILLFLDSDILIPSAFIDELIEKHARYDLIQGRRVQLTERATHSGLSFFTQVIESADTEPGSAFWETFNARTTDWNQLPDRWKFTSTFCLSIKKNHFHQLGAFRRSFAKYGFEDTDLGFRSAQLGLRFHLSPTRVFHFKHPVQRSEYFNSQRKKEALLRDSCRVFFLANQHLDILNSHGKYLTEKI